MNKILLVLVLIVIGGIATFFTRSSSLPVRDNPKSVPDTTLQPVKITENFYRWYLSYPGNALISGAYKSRPDLSDSFKVKVEDIFQRYNGKGGYDPILLAQDKPTSIKTGKEIIEGDSARVQLDEDFSGTTQSLQVELKQQGGTWQITDVQAINSPTPLSADNIKKVIVYYSNPAKQSGPPECGVVFGVERVLPKDAGYDELLSQLFLGPTSSEKKQGYSSPFSKSTTDILKNVKITGTTAYVDFTDIRTIIPNSSSSCGSREFLAQVGETLKHNRKIDKIIYAIKENPKTFYEWLQLGCSKENNNCDPAPFK